MKKDSIWNIVLSIILLIIISNTIVYWSDLPCIAGDLFWQQQYIPHFTGSIPTTSQLWSYLFPIYKYNLVENSSLCGIMNSNTLLPSNNTYTYCKNGILKDLIWYNISWIEQNLDTTIYRHIQCQQNRNSDCNINNTTIKDSESLTFFESSSSVYWICKSETRTCNNWVLSWSYYHTSCTNYSGLCGTSHETSSINPPTLNLCRAGVSYTIPFFNNNTHKWTWNCQWIQWNSETCIAYKDLAFQWTGQCKNYLWWVTTLSPESQFLCSIWSGINLNETTLWRTWTCISEYGSSPQCSTQKSLTTTWTIIYTTNRDNSVTASVINIAPYWAYIINNNNSNSKRFTQNGTFIFQIKFNDSITDVIAQVHTINNRTMKIKALIQDYRNNMCNAQKNIKIKESSKYSLLDVQTMVNHCLLNIKQSKNWYNINMKKNITRGEFITSAYNFIKTIRPYNNTSYNISPDNYNWVPNQPLEQEAIKRLITIKWDQYINHTTSKNTATYKRNNYITSKEIYNLVIYILNSHDDNDIYFKSLWDRETINSTMKWSQYANLMRRILEQYDRTALGNNIIALEDLENRISWLSTINQNNELQEIYNQLHSKDSTSFEKSWLSKRALLNDINTLISGWISNKKTVLSTSLQDVINKSKSDLITTKQEKTKILFKKMSY